MEQTRRCDQNPLSCRIAERIRAKGPLSFADYMAACLYEPGLGYYTSPGRKVGAEGDFYTSSNVHALFGRLIAREISAMWEALDRPTDFTLCEVGAGGGRLAADILDGIRDQSPRLYSSMIYRFIEQEPSLADAQKELCLPHESRLAWSSPDDLLSGALKITGCFLSNELVDAFPTHLVEMTAEGLKEVFVDVVDDSFQEILREPSSPEIALYFARLGLWPEQGQRAEVNLNGGRWLSSVAASLVRGFVLTIDYGFEALELYGPMRKNGTLLCYYRHQVVDNPYQKPGEQDITSHVDFTSLKLAGSEAGLDTVWFGEQYRFLMAAGMMQELLLLEQQRLSEQEQLKNRLALKKLMLPEGGMGDTFKVLIQSKGVVAPKLLSLRDWTAGF